MYHDRFSFYRSDEWSKFRRLFIAQRIQRDGELICDNCHKAIVNPYDAILHHKTELDEINVHDVNVALNPDNISLVCHRCHDQIHERFEFKPSNVRIKHVYIVWGSPCAGKSAYVQSHAGKEDLIIDIDALYNALGTGERSAITHNVMSIYRSLIDQVKTRSGKWLNAWIVRTLPLQIDRDTIVRDCGGGELIRIDTSMEECLLEAKVRGGKWTDWVKQYWDRFQPED